MEIILKNISYKYKTKKILDNINLKVKCNQIIGLTGESKTLLCELLDATIKPSEGEILFEDICLGKPTLKEIRKKVCVIKQDYRKQFFTDNVNEEIEFLLSRLNYKPKDLAKKKKQALEIVGLNESYLDKNISELSAGDRKLIQIAIGLINNPSIIIFDETFTELDNNNRKVLVKLIKNLKTKYNKTVVISSNDANLLYELTDEIIVLRKGKVLVFGDTVETYKNVELLSKNNIEIPDLIMFTYLAKDKKVKLSYHRDIRDLIKDVYKHV